MIIKKRILSFIGRRLPRFYADFFVFFRTTVKYSAIPIGHSINLKGEYETVSLVLEKKIKYEEHRSVICVDLKMANFLLR